MTKDSDKRGEHLCRECVYYKRVDWMLISLCRNCNQDDRLVVEPDYDACELFEGRVNELQAD